MRWRIGLAFACVLAAVPPGCGGPTEPAPLVDAVVIEPVEGVVWAEDVRPLHAELRDARGVPVQGRTILWSSSHPAVATVDTNGLLEARAAGSTVIAATSEGKRGEVVLTVAEADLLYEGYRTGLPEMSVLSLRGGQPERILPPHAVMGRPVPAPDGSRVAFVMADYIDWQGDIYVVSREGTDLRQITFAEELDDQPAWSPDGTRIAFRSYRTGRAGDIWVMNADGSNPILLTPDPLPGVTDEMRPAWSPDGTRIAYASNAGGSMNIWTMGADGTDPRQLTNTASYDTEPTWSPDGDLIAFRRSHPQTGSVIMVVPAAGGNPTPLTHTGMEIEPAWSPHGRLIAFTVLAVGGGTPQIHTMRPDGTEITLRTTDLAWNGGRAPGWLRRTW